MGQTSINIVVWLYLFADENLIHKLCGRQSWSQVYKDFPFIEKKTSARQNNFGPGPLLCFSSFSSAGLGYVFEGNIQIAIMAVYVTRIFGVIVGLSFFLSTLGFIFSRFYNVYSHSRACTLTQSLSLSNTLTHTPSLPLHVTLSLTSIKKDSNTLEQ